MASECLAYRALAKEVLYTMLCRASTSKQISDFLVVSRSVTVIWAMYDWVAANCIGNRGLNYTAKICQLVGVELTFNEA
jgi:hypothetical protein